MWLRRFRIAGPIVAVFILGLAIVGAGSPTSSNPLFQVFSDDSGTFSSVSTAYVDKSNPFFQPLGSNGRSCATCHLASNAMTISPASVQKMFQDTQGLAPIFRTVDGSNSPNADVSTVSARMAAYSTLLNRGTIRIGIGMPATADFALTAVDDPYGFASVAQLSLFRRPLPSTNAAFFSSVMWDGRETFANATIVADMFHQATDAVLTHEQGGAPPTQAQLTLIVALQRNLYTAGYADAVAGPLSVAGARGGATNLSRFPFYYGMNDSFGRNPSSPKFDPNSMTLYTAWLGQSGSPTADQRASIARGEVVFTTKPITITNVAGFNDVIHQSVVVGHCTSCHDTPNTAGRSMPDFMNTGVAAASRRTSDLPLYTFTCNSGRVVQTMDPGRGLITGKCDDLMKFKVPTLRGLDARSAYFHDGSGTGFQAVVDFYNTRFNIGLTQQEETDLMAFLATL